MLPEEMLFLVITIIWWNLIAWLFWAVLQMLRHSRMKHRRLTEGKKQAAHESEEKA